MGECVAAGVRDAVIGNPPGITVIGNSPGIARECVTVAGVLVTAVDAMARYRMAGGSVADVQSVRRRSVKARCMTKVPARMERRATPFEAAATTPFEAAATAAFAAGDCGRDVRDKTKRAHCNARRQNSYCSLLHGTFPTLSF